MMAEDAIVSGKGSGTSSGPARVAKLTGPQLAELQLESGYSDKTIRKWARGGRVTTPVRMALARAAKKLAIPVLR
jgi:hypothetical protein